MNTNLLEQLRAYGEDFDAATSPVTLNELVHDTDAPVRVQPLNTQARRPIPGWIPAVTAAAVVLVIGGLAFLVRDSEEAGAPDASAPVVSAPVVDSTVAESAPIPVYESDTPPMTAPVYGSEPGGTLGCEVPSGWVQVCDPASFDGTAMYAVTAGGPGLVAVGGNGLEYYTREGNSDLGGYGGEAPVGSGDAVVWTSPDGLTWTRVPRDVATFGGDGGQQMFGVTAGGPGLVAVGRDGPVADGQGNAAVWTSPDGFTWSRVPNDEAVFGGEGEQRMVSVTAGGPGLVAVGFDNPAEQGEGNAAVWTSPDGFVWSRVSHDEAVFGGNSRQMMLGVTAGGPGLVAVGTDGYSFRGDESWSTEYGFDVLAAAKLAADAAVWTSPDGFTWSRVPHDEAIFGGLGEQRMNSVTAGGPGLVAVGSVTGELVGWYARDAAVWTSSDGLTWSRVPHNEDIFATSDRDSLLAEVYPGQFEEQMLSVAAGEFGLVAVGFDSADECGWDSAVWTSPDGFTWSRVPDERSCGGTGGYDRMLSVTVGPSGLVAVGEEHSPVAAAVWNG